MSDKLSVEDAAIHFSDHAWTIAVSLQYVSVRKALSPSFDLKDIFTSHEQDHSSRASHL